MSNGYVDFQRGEAALGLLPDDCRNVGRLAEMYGWRDREGACALFFFGDGAEDDAGSLDERQAAALAAALESALPDIPDHDARRPKLRPCAWAGAAAEAHGWLEEDPRNPLTLLERFSGDEKELLKELIAFLRRGAFRVVYQPW